MPEIWPTETNYNCEKKAKNPHNKAENKITSFCHLTAAISMWLVAITAKGAKVNTAKSLLLPGESTKTKMPIKKAEIIFL